MIEKIKDWFAENRFIAPSLIIAIIGGVTFALLMATNPAFAGWGETLIGLSFLFTVLGLFDKIFLKSMDIIDELRESNTAVAIVLAAIILGFCYLSAAIAGGGLKL